MSSEHNTKGGSNGHFNHVVPTKDNVSSLLSPEPSWQIMWHVLKVEVSSLQHRPSHQYLDMRQECKTFKSVASRPCDWLFLILAMRAGGASLTKAYGKIDEQ